MHVTNQCIIVVVVVVRGEKQEGGRSMTEEKEAMVRMGRGECCLPIATVHYARLTS
jgi:hypothetical protein